MKKEREEKQRQILRTYDKELLVDLYIQKCQDSFMEKQSMIERIEFKEEELEFERRGNICIVKQLNDPKSYVSLEDYNKLKEQLIELNKYKHIKLPRNEEEKLKAIDISNFKTALDLYNSLTAVQKDYDEAVSRYASIERWMKEDMYMYDSTLEAQAAIIKRKEIKNEQEKIDLMNRLKKLLLKENKEHPIVYDKTADIVGGAIDKDRCFEIIDKLIEELEVNKETLQNKAKF